MKLFFAQVLDAWDILYQQKAPVLSIKVSEFVCRIYHECSGKKIGDVKPLQVSDHAVNVVKVHEQVRGLSHTKLQLRVYNQVITTCKIKNTILTQQKHQNFEFSKGCLTTVGHIFQF